MTYDLAVRREVHHDVVEMDGRKMMVELDKLGKWRMTRFDDGTWHVQLKMDCGIRNGAVEVRSLFNHKTQEHAMQYVLDSVNRRSAD